MTTLAADARRNYELGDIEEYGVIASDIIYQGAAVGDNGSGYARPLVAGDPFLGFAEAQVDNSTGAAGAKNVRVRRRGRVQLSIGSLAITDVGKPVYASDDDTFTLTQSTNTCVGTVIRFISTGVGIVEFGGVQNVIVELTDSTTGAVSNTLDDTTAAQKDDVASLAAKVNEIIRFLNRS